MEIMLTANTVTGVRIPLSPPEKAEPVDFGGLFTCLFFPSADRGKPLSGSGEGCRRRFSENSLRQKGFSWHLNDEFAGESREWGRWSIPFLNFIQVLLYIFFIQVLLYFLLIVARIYSILLVTISASREGRTERESGRGNWDTLAAKSLLTEGTFLFLPPFGGADSFCLYGEAEGVECGRIPQVFRE